MQTILKFLSFIISPKYSCPFISSPYGYLGLLVLLYIFVNIFCLLVLYHFGYKTDRLDSRGLDRG